MNRENKDLKKKYLAIKKSLYSGVIAAIDSGNSMDDVLASLSSKYSNFSLENCNNNENIYQNCIDFFYYMYFICDLGKNE